MPNFKVLSSKPDSLSFSKFTDSIQLSVHGQGIFLFSTSNTSSVSFTFHTSDKSDGLTVNITSTECIVKHISNSNTYTSQSKKGVLSTKSGAYYWFSLDSQNQTLHAGVGEPRMETSCFSYQFEQNKLWEANKVFLESLVSISLPLDQSITPLKLLKNPITTSVPMKIKDTKDLTMDDVAGSEYLPNANLSPSAQILYNSISGPNFTLNTPDFPDFSEAIEYSIKTPGCWCNTRLQQKATEFDKDPQPLETYLRITLGQNNGESPGIPYVMEIWPVGHYSPIHNHSGANAIIRVLYGKINVSLYPFLCDSPESVEPFAETQFVKDDITWISPTLNQVHKLKNLDSNTQTCITIQCYMYDSSDTNHYDYFDYLGSKNAKQQYEPDSDMEFLEFKKTIRKEWDSRIKRTTELKLSPKCTNTPWCYCCP
jgi:hypothetical protein